jgi:hypothetical protein
MLSDTTPTTNNNAEARDNALADAAYFEDDVAGALERLRAVRTPDALRALFASADGYRLGGSGRAERVLLEQALQLPDDLRELLVVFFRELGGRFYFEKTRACVFSVLIELDAERWRNDVDEPQPGDVARWAARVDAVVECLVVSAGLPVRMQRRYSLPGQAHLAECSALHELAYAHGAWPMLFALARHLDPRLVRAYVAPEARLEQVLRHGYMRPLCVYWTRVFAAEVEDEEALARRSEHALALDVPACTMALALRHEAAQRALRRLRAE